MVGDESFQADTVEMFAVLASDRYFYPFFCVGTYQTKFSLCNLHIPTLFSE